MFFHSWILFFFFALLFFIMTTRKCNQWKIEWKKFCKDNIIYIHKHVGYTTKQTNKHNRNNEIETHTHAKKNAAETAGKLFCVCFCLRAVPLSYLRLFLLYCNCVFVLAFVLFCIWEKMFCKTKTSNTNCNGKISKSRSKSNVYKQQVTESNKVYKCIAITVWPLYCKYPQFLCLILDYVIYFLDCVMNSRDLSSCLKLSDCPRCARKYFKYICQRREKLGA